MEGQGRRHHCGNQEGSCQQDESKTAKRDPGGGGYPFYSSFVIVPFLFMFVCYPSYLTLFALQHVMMFDSNHISSPSSDTQTSSQSLGRVSLRKENSG